MMLRSFFLLFVTTTLAFQQPQPQHRIHSTTTKTSSPSSSLLSLSSTSTTDNAAHGLLYKEQEELLIQRGKFEEELMKDNYEPLAANPPPRGSSASTTGFGAAKNTAKSKKKKNSNAIFAAEGAAHAAVLNQQGVVRIDNVLKDTQLVDELRQFVMDLRADGMEKVFGQQQNVVVVDPKERFADVLLRSNRVDLKIPLMGVNAPLKKYNLHVDNTHIVERALDAVLNQSPVPATIAAAFAKYVTPPDKSPVLYELSTLISDPGSQRQTMHPDNPIHQQQNAVPVLYTCFIALQDVLPEMGPTVYLPGTHTKEYHDIFFQDTIPEGETESPKDKLLKTHKAVLGTLPKGCAAIYDSRILHCGSANQSVPPQEGVVDQRRAIFYFSFKNPNIGYPGNPASIRPEIGASQITLAELQQAVATAVQQQKKKNTSNLQNPFPWNQ